MIHTRWTGDVDDETGRLFFGISWSPSFRSGMTSDIFHAAVKTDDNKDRFTMSVSTEKKQGSVFLITDMATLSNPGALLDENDSTAIRIPWLETAQKLNFSSSGIYCPLVKSFASDALAPTDTKNLLNSSATALTSVSYTHLTLPTSDLV